MGLGNVFPQLQPHAWPGLEHSSCRKLFPSHGLQEEPWVALVYPLAPLTAFVGPRRLETLGQSLEEVEAESLANLVSKTFSWKPVNLEKPNGGTLGLAMLSDPFAAECILVEAIMREPAETLFKSSMTAVGIPQRGTLLTVPIGAVQDGGFATMVRNLYEKAPQEVALTPSVFVVKEGKLVGRLD